MTFVAAHVEEGPAREDLAATIDALDPQFGEMVYALAGVAGLAESQRRMRSVAALLQFAAVQLADDLADGDCCYLADPGRTGPGAQWLLQHLSQLALLHGSVATQAAREAAACFARVGAAQQREVRQAQWDVGMAAAAARELNGAQYTGYLTWLWAGTAWQTHARQVGHDFGFCLHVASDRRCRDRRFTDLPEAGQQALLDEACGRYQRLQDRLPATFVARLAWLQAAVGGEMRHGGGEHRMRSRR